MHTGRGRETRADVVEDQWVFLERSLEIAAAAGVADGQIVLDPGFGFAKDVDENLSLMARFGELHRFARPWLVGTSRKRFWGRSPAARRRSAMWRRRRRRRFCGLRARRYSVSMMSQSTGTRWPWRMLC